MSLLKSIFPVILILFQKAAQAQLPGFTLDEASDKLEHIDGETQNGGYLYATAGSRIYCIGSQSGSFPDIGFHVPGEMGGIWQQPVKLMDGFDFTIRDRRKNNSIHLRFDRFTAYPFVTKFRYADTTEKITVVQTQFVPDNLPAMAIEYKIQNNSSEEKNISFEWQADVNLMPVWLAERIGITDGTDQFFSFDSTGSILTVKDGSNNWFAGIQFDNHSTRLREIKKSSRKEKGLTGIMTVDLDIPAHSQKYLRIYISGSLKNSQELNQNLAFVKSRLPDLFEEKKNRYIKIANTAELSLPDTLLQKAYNWGKYATDWLRRDVPGLGRGLSAGLPDYPWFFSNDQASTFMALTGTLPPQIFFDAFGMLKRISDKANDSSGRIIHEVSSNGVVYHKGNMQESQLHIIAAWQIFKWTGNIQFLKENYSYAKKIWKWLQMHDTNHNGYIEGYGGTEIEGLNDEMLDVQINTCLFLDVLGRMANVFGESDNARLYTKKSSALKEKINREWWVDSEGFYADFLSSKEKAIQLIDDALAKRVKPERNLWAREKLNHLKTAIQENRYPYPGYLVYYNSGGLAAATEGIADTTRALQMIRQYSFFTNKFGTYIAGIERPDNISADERAFQKDSSFSYNRAVMPIATAGLIIAAARYGMPDTALLYMHRMLNTFSFATPGTTYEVSPDYGMFVQAWNITCLNTPIIHYFFGISPEAHKKEISIRPRMPSDWKNASLKNLIIGNTRFSIQYLKEKDTVTCVLQSSEPGWKVHFITDGAPGKLIINHTIVQPSGKWIELGTARQTIQYKSGK